MFDSFGPDPRCQFAADTMRSMTTQQNAHMGGGAVNACKISCVDPHCGHANL